MATEQILTRYRIMGSWALLRTGHPELTQLSSSLRQQRIMEAAVELGAYFFEKSRGGFSIAGGTPSPHPVFNHL